MAAPRIALVDYDSGNLTSVTKALAAVGARVLWAESPSGLKGADALVLPGVGSFLHAVRNLKRRKLFNPIRSWIEQGRPFFGICLGYQLLFERGEEAEGTRGLSLFAGRVRRFPAAPGLKIPHMGWNRVWRKRNGASRLFARIQDGAYFYFVHSYYPEPVNGSLVATTTDYGAPFASSVGEGNLFACQFHPEKSGGNGLELLRNFVRQI